jgi:hypothetical protein
VVAVAAGLPGGQRAAWSGQTLRSSSCLASWNSARAAVLDEIALAAHVSATTVITRDPALCSLGVLSRATTGSPSPSHATV